MQKAINTNTIKQGSVIVAVTKLGVYKSIAPVKNENTDITPLSTRLAERFDDLNYYTRPRG